MFLERPALRTLEEARNIAFAVSSMSGSDEDTLDIHAGILDKASPDSSWNETKGNYLNIVPIKKPKNRSGKIGSTMTD